MSKKTLLNDLANELCNAFPKQLHDLKQDFEKSCHLILTKTFAKFDLVTRDEFDTQTKVLQRTRKKLDDLEKQLIVLESLLQKKGDA